MEDEGHKTLTEHLGELRKRIITVIVVLAIMMVAGFFVAVPVFDFVKNLPPADKLQLHALSPSDGLRIYLQFSLLFATLVSAPLLFYQIWAFVKPGLQREEQKAALKFVPLSFFLFISGIAFSYFVVCKLAFTFTASLNQRMNLEETYGVAQYFSFILNIIIPISLLFELPVVIMFLTVLRIVNPAQLRKLRRYAYLILVICSTLIAPPDFISNILVVIPLILLYEISVLLSNIIYQKQMSKEWKMGYTMHPTK